MVHGLLAMSILMAALIGLRAFTTGVRFVRRSGAPIRGRAARIVGIACVAYALVALVGLAWLAARTSSLGLE